MRPSTLREAVRLGAVVKKAAGRQRGLEVAIAPPFVYLARLHEALRGSAVMLGAQDVFWEREGAYTGEISALMLASIGVSYVIVGHSERRALGETDEQVTRKTRAALGNGLSPIVCVGERARDAAGQHLAVVEAQLRAACAAVSKTNAPALAVAYEPVWAISDGAGRGTAATPRDVHEMVLFIRKTLVDRYGRRTAEQVRILYGGSVDAVNATTLMDEGAAQGFLVGGASVDARAFEKILSAVHERKT